MPTLRAIRLFSQAGGEERQDRESCGVDCRAAFGAGDSLGEATQESVISEINGLNHQKWPFSSIRKH
jgi:hypothetical protein